MVWTFPCFPYSYRNTAFSQSKLTFSKCYFINWTGLDYRFCQPFCLQRNNYGFVHFIGFVLYKKTFRTVPWLYVIQSNESWSTCFVKKIQWSRNRSKVRHFKIYIMIIIPIYPIITIKILSLRLTQLGKNNSVHFNNNNNNNRGQTMWLFRADPISDVFFPNIGRYLIRYFLNRCFNL